MKPLKFNFPPGYHFLPTDAELLVHYLTNKNLGLPLPIEVIQEIDIYNFNPDDLSRYFKVGEENDMYFFTQRNRKYEGGARPARKAGNGYWKATTGKDIVLDQDRVVGYKMNLKFHIGMAPKGEKTDWLMTEYRIDEVDPPTTTTAMEAGRGKRKRVATAEDDHPPIKMNGFVLCRIYKNKCGAKKTNEAPVNEVIFEDPTSYLAPCYEDQTNIINYKSPQPSTSSWHMPCYNSEVTDSNILLSDQLQEITPEDEWLANFIENSLL